MASDSEENTARGIGLIIAIAIVFAALYPLAVVTHFAWRIFLAGWGS